MRQLHLRISLLLRQVMGSQTRLIVQRGSQLQVSSSIRSR